MVSQVAERPKIVDKFLWSLAFTILAVAVASNYYFASYSLLLRVLGLVLCAGIAVFIAFRTRSGREFWSFCLGAIQEVRKMYWPTRQETVQTTLAVLGMVVVMGILLWTADFMLLKAVQWLTGHWGV